MEYALVSYGKDKCVPIEGQGCETFKSLVQPDSDKEDDKRKEKKKADKDEDEDRNDNKKKDKDQDDVSPKNHDDQDDKDDKIPTGKLSPEAQSLRETLLELLDLITKIDSKERNLDKNTGDL